MYPGFNESNVGFGTDFVGVFIFLLLIGVLVGVLLVSEMENYKYIYLIMIM